MINFNNILEFFLQLIFPPRCPMCGQLVERNTTVCEQCKPQVRRILPPICNKCGMNKSDCECASNRHLFTACVSPFYYYGAVKNGVRRFKFHDKYSSTTYFINETAKKVDSEFAGYMIDLVVCVPMHENDLQTRGFNSAELLAKGIAKKLKLPCDCTVLTKIYENKKQRTLSAFERVGNVLGVFDVKNPEKVKGKTILLCDDIFTTGATLDECAKMLYFGGADTVLCACSAITPPLKSREE